MSSKKFINKIDYFTTFFFYMSIVGGGVFEFWMSSLETLGGASRSTRLLAMISIP